MDGVKLILKESILPRDSSSFLFILAPLLTFYLALCNWLFLPLGPDNIVSEIPGGGILVIIAITELGIYGIFYAGWSGNSKYP